MIREFLEERRLALTRSVRQAIGRPDSGELVGQPTEAADQATATLLRELDAQLADRQSRQVAVIEAALERIERREYGACRECGDFIGLARLKALPFALRCRPCQDRAERARRAEPAEARQVLLMDPVGEAERP